MVQSRHAVLVAAACFWCAGAATSSSEDVNTPPSVLPTTSLSSTVGPGPSSHAVGAPDGDLRSTPCPEKLSTLLLGHFPETLDPTSSTDLDPTSSSDPTTDPRTADTSTVECADQGVNETQLDVENSTVDTTLPCADFSSVIWAEEYDNETVLLNETDFDNETFGFNETDFDNETFGFNETDFDNETFGFNETEFDNETFGFNETDFDSETFGSNGTDFDFNETDFDNETMFSNETNFDNETVFSNETDFGNETLITNETDDCDDLEFTESTKPPETNLTTAISTTECAGTEAGNTSHTVSLDELAHTSTSLVSVQAASSFVSVTVSETTTECPDGQVPHTTEIGVATTECPPVLDASTTQRASRSTTGSPTTAENSTSTVVGTTFSSTRTASRQEERTSAHTMQTIDTQTEKRGTSLTRRTSPKYWENNEEYLDYMSRLQSRRSSTTQWDHHEPTLPLPHFSAPAATHLRGGGMYP